MGAITQRQSSAQFYRIIDGSICLKSDNERDGYELFTTQNPQTKATVSYYIKRFDGLVGYLTAFERVDKPDKQVHGWQLTLSDEDGNYCLSLKDKNSATSRVLKMLKSVDLAKPLTIRAWLDTKGDRPKTAIKFEQDEQNVPQAYEKDELPPPKERPNGQLDWSAQEDKLYADAIAFGEWLPTVAHKVAQKARVEYDNDPLFTGPDVSQAPPENLPDNPDDLPF